MFAAGGFTVPAPAAAQSADSSFVEGSYRLLLIIRGRDLYFDL